jgi:molybdopterin/thiamine biosynthesis adenylyltransferase
MGSTYQELLAEARQSVPEVDPGDLPDSGGSVAFVDVREPDEWAEGVITDSLRIPRGTIEYTIAGHLPDPNNEIVVYCAGGHRSLLAARTLQQLGYRNVSSLRGGFTAWRKSGRTWAANEGLTTEQRARYSRHLVLPGVGESGQKRLLDGRVMIVGAGGLGSPAALYLAAAGVGTIGLVDDDIVDASNLQRQVIHSQDRVGTQKVESARRSIAALNSDVKVESYAGRLNASNALDLLAGYDVIIDGADNFPTRYLINDAAMHLGAPVVHGSVLRYEGQVSVFEPHQGPCYRCLFRLPPPPELAPSCAEAGVLGALPGVIGSIQAMEALKLLLGTGDSLAGRLLIYDALAQTFRALRLDRDPECPACSDPDQPPALVDYDEACRPG